ncbi:hypothetical protein [Nostoc sp.]
MDKLWIGTVPAEEECQQVGTFTYDAIAAKKECRVYKEYLQRLFPIPQELEEDLAYSIDTSGGYYEVMINFNSNDEKAVEFAYNVEANTPTSWDETAIAELDNEGVIECE